jgi:ubiquinone/menaquinone biosynthesis C-methylase UbiE
MPSNLALSPSSELILHENLRVHALEADCYDALHREIFNRFEQAWLERDLDELCRAGPGEVLDVGPGTGNITLKLLARGLRVTAVDLSREMLAELERRAEPHREQLHIECAGIDAYLERGPRLPPLVTMSSLLHQLPRPEVTLRRLAEALPPGGLLYLTHEPTGARLPPLVRTLDLADRGLWNLVHPRLATYGRSVDYSISDYHARAGLAPERLEEVLRDAGLRVLRRRLYGTAKFAALARLRCSLGDRSEITLLARKEEG